MNQPLVSIIVPTRNSAMTLEACLESIVLQTYPSIELIIVDRGSIDETKLIAARYTSKVFNKEPERCAQRNYGAQQAKGDYLIFIDSDMELSKDVITACVTKIAEDADTKGVIIPEQSFGEGFWAQCKQLERSFYIGVDWIEAARFFDAKTFREVGGYDEGLISGEDWDLSQRVAAIGKLARIDQLIRHNEGHLHLFRTLRKKSYYAQQFTAYTDRPKPVTTSRNPYIIVLKRFGLFLSKPQKLFRNPLLGFGVLFMKACEFAFGAFGYLLPKKQHNGSI